MHVSFPVIQSGTRSHQNWFCQPSSPRSAVKQEQKVLQDSYNSGFREAGVRLKEELFSLAEEEQRTAAALQQSSSVVFSTLKLPSSSD
mmetsp:Transcript_52232/g.102266  ORF Transcript_52232/g.102266 Transcript_52232/m.102266 type:complete len:88 (+) Transcript_52232:113-376(+)